MLQDFVDRLCKELVITSPNLNEEKLYLLKIAGESITLKDLDPGISLQAPICPIPKQKKEELFSFLMRANLLGQGTADNRIGLDSDEKFLTLSLGLPYELNYQSFKETIEDFVNYLLYWREQVAKFEAIESVY